MTRTDQPSDSALLQEFARQASQPAFRALAERHAGLVFSAALRRTGQRALAEEIAQNVFAVLARKAGALCSPDVNLPAWLHRATVLEAARARRKEANRIRHMENYLQHATTLSAADASAWQSLLPELDAALDDLPPRDRELLLARFFEDRSYRDLATATGRSEAALMQHQHRALEKLGDRLRRRGVVVPAALLAAGLTTGLTHAAPAGLAATLAAAAPAAASSLGFGALFWHTVNTLMQTKTRLTLAAAVAACFLGGTGAYVAGKSQAEARGEALLAAATAPQPPTVEVLRSPPVSPATPAPAPALTLQEKIDQAITAWRATTDESLRTKALLIIDALSPEEMPAAQAAVAKIKAEYGLHLALAKRVALLWGRTGPAPALAWLTTELPREHRQEPMRAILENWARHDHTAALAWWRGVAESLDFPIAEDAFEQLDADIYTGWAATDPVSLVAALPEVPDIKALKSDPSPTVSAQLTGLATAASRPETREAVLAAIAAIKSDGTKAAAAGMVTVMLGMIDPAACGQFSESLTFTDPAIRGEYLTSSVLFRVGMGSLEPEAAIATLLTKTDEATVRNAIEEFARDNPEGATSPKIKALRAALDKPRP